MKREEVERMLYMVETGHPSLVDMPMELTRTQVTALCRRWLEVEDAPVATMDKREFLSLCVPTWEDFPALYALHGKRVRLVPEAGQEVGK